MDTTDFDARQLEDLLHRYFDAGLDEDGERTLKELLRQADPQSLSAEARAAAVLFRGFGALARTGMPRRRRNLRPLRRIAATAAAAAAAAVLATALTVRILWPVYGYDEAGKAIRDTHTAFRQTECLALLEGLEESFRNTDALLRAAGDRPE